MGLSSAQARLLMLSARLSDVELQQMTIAQRQNKLAMNSQSAASEYNKAMNNYKLTINIITKDGENEKSEKEDLNFENMISMGYLVTNAQEQVYLTKDSSGNWVVPKDMEGKELLKIDQTTGKATIGEKQYEIVDGTKLKEDSKTLQQLILNGALFVSNVNESKQDLSLQQLESNTEIEYVLDTSDDAKAQSKYDYELASVATKENQLEMELKQLDTQHEALMKEYESTKELINSNVDRTFSIFSNG